MQHLLTVWRSPWQPSLFDPRTYKRVRKHWWRFGPGLKPTTFCASCSKLFLLSDINTPVMSLVTFTQVFKAGKSSRLCFAPHACNAVADPRFPRGETPTYYLVNFCRKMHENKRKRTQKGASLTSPRSTTTLDSSDSRGYCSLLSSRCPEWRLISFTRFLSCSATFVKTRQGVLPSY